MRVYKKKQRGLKMDEKEQNLEKNEEDKGENSSEEDKEEIKDKKAESEEEEKEAKEKSEDEIIKELQDEIEKLKVKDIILQMMTSLTSFGYQRLGLPKELNAGKKDLDQAKMAIDALSALFEVVKDDLDDQEKNAFETTVANLRMSFVAQKD